MVTHRDTDFVELERFHCSVTEVYHYSLFIIYYYSLFSLLMFVVYSSIQYDDFLLIVKFLWQYILS